MERERGEGRRRSGNAEGGFTCTYSRLSWMGSFLSTFWSEKKNFFLKVRITVSSIPCSRRDLSGFSQFTEGRREGRREGEERRGREGGGVKVDLKYQKHIV